MQFLGSGRQIGQLGRFRPDDHAVGGEFHRLRIRSSVRHRRVDVQLDAARNDRDLLDRSCLRGTFRFERERLPRPSVKPDAADGCVRIFQPKTAVVESGRREFQQLGLLNQRSRRLLPLSCRATEQRIDHGLGMLARPASLVGHAGLAPEVEILSRMSACSTWPTDSNVVFKVKLDPIAIVDPGMPDDHLASDNRGLALFDEAVSSHHGNHRAVVRSPLVRDVP